VAHLPARQRVVVELQDRDGLSASEVYGLLELGPAYQRVLLHFARAKPRSWPDEYHSYDEVNSETIRRYSARMA